jgi:hypothetical protein
LITIFFSNGALSKTRMFLETMYNESSKGFEMANENEESITIDIS